MSTSCTSPPSSFKWNLPISNTNNNWDLDPTTWNIPIYGLTATILNTSVLKDTTAPVSNTGCTLEYGLGSCPTENNCMPITNNLNGCYRIVNGAPQQQMCNDGDIITAITYSATQTQVLCPKSDTC